MAEGLSTEVAVAVAEPRAAGAARLWAALVALWALVWAARLRRGLTGAAATRLQPGSTTLAVGTVTTAGAARSRPRMYDVIASHMKRLNSAGYAAAGAEFHVPSSRCAPPALVWVPGACEHTIWWRGRSIGARPAVKRSVVYFCTSALNMHCANVTDSAPHAPWRAHTCGSS